MTGQPCGLLSRCERHQRNTSDSETSGGEDLIGMAVMIADLFIADSAKPQQRWTTGGGSWSSLLVNTEKVGECCRLFAIDFRKRANLSLRIRTAISHKIWNLHHTSSAFF